MTIKFSRDAITFSTGKLWRRIAFIGLILALFTPAIYRSCMNWRADRIARSDATVAGFSCALQYNPGDATLWWSRARLRHYAVDDVDFAQAIVDYRKALEINPRLVQAWMDLANAYEQTGNFAQAEDALGHAVATRTYSPAIHWQAGNFFLRRGNLERMYEYFKPACRYDPERLGIAIDLSWKADSNHAAILEKLVPDELSANLRYLGFLLSRNELELARAAWERCLKNHAVGSSEFQAASAFGYIDRLLSANRIEDAIRVWDEALQKSGTAPPATRIAGSAGKANMVWNGSFENEILRGGFDWRLSERTDIELQSDTNNPIDGFKCFRVTFTGTNIQFAGLRQIMPVPAPGTYKLEFYLRSESLSSDQRPYFAIRGYPDAAGAALRTEPFPESTPWKKISVSFEVRKGCRAVQLELRRDTSEKFRSEIKGSLWLDGISILPANPAPAPGGSPDVDLSLHHADTAPALWHLCFYLTVSRWGSPGEAYA